MSEEEEKEEVEKEKGEETWTQGTVREGPKERQAGVFWSREHLGGNSAALGPGLGSGAVLGGALAQRCSFPGLRAAGERGGERGGGCSPSALVFWQVPSFSPLHPLPAAIAQTQGPVLTSQKVTPFKECGLAPFPHFVPKIALEASASKAAL